MSNYKSAIAELLKQEGVYSKDPRDAGGETFRGISRRYFPKWEGWPIVDINHFDERLDKMVEDFYKHYFWDKLELDDVEDNFAASMLFNASVNMGVKSTIKKVQRILNVTVDGIIGPKTIGALNTVETDTFVFQFLLEMVDLYNHIVNRDRGQRRFLHGWINRVMTLYHEYLSI